MAHQISRTGVKSTIEVSTSDQISVDFASRRPTAEPQRSALSPRRLSLSAVLSAFTAVLRTDQGAIYTKGETTTKAKGKEPLLLIQNPQR